MHILGEGRILSHYIPYLLDLLQKQSSRATTHQQIQNHLGDEIIERALKLIESVVEHISAASALRSLVLQSSQLMCLLLNPSANHLLTLPRLIQTLALLSSRIGIFNIVLLDSNLAFNTF